MPDRDKGSHYENHQHAAELQNLPTHAHSSAAVHHGKEDHLTGHEMTRQAQEHSPRDFEETRHKPTHQEIAALAHELWVERGSPEGSAEEDWLKAEEQLMSERSR